MRTIMRGNFLFNPLFYAKRKFLMIEKRSMRDVYKVFTIDKCICNYLTDYFFYEESNRYYADKANISETIIRKIRRTIGYRIPISTLKKITDSLDIKLSTLLREVEKANFKELETEYQFYRQVDNEKFVKLNSIEVRAIGKIR